MLEIAVSKIQAKGNKESKSLSLIYMLFPFLSQRHGAVLCTETSLSKAAFNFFLKKIQINLTLV